MKTYKRLLVVLFLVLVMGAGLAGSVGAGPGEPLPGTVRGLGGPYTFYNASSGITETTYTSQPKTVQGQDVSIIWLYHSADIFVTADVSGTDTITVTPQVSVDGANWTDVTYTYVADTLAQTTTVLTSTGTTTATSTTSMSSAVTEGIERVVLSTDTTDYLRIALAGKYLRLKIETSGTVTPTIKVLLRND
jgi:hypothetical protein